MSVTSLPLTVVVSVTGPESSDRLVDFGLNPVSLLATLKWRELFATRSYHVVLAGPVAVA